MKHWIKSCRNSTKENCDTEFILRFSFTKSEKLINLLSMSEGIGKVEFVFSETKAQQSASELSVVVVLFLATACAGCNGEKNRLAVHVFISVLSLLNV